MPYRDDLSIRAESDLSGNDLKPENIVPDRAIDDIRSDPAGYNDKHGTSSEISDFDDISAQSDRSVPKSESDRLYRSFYGCIDGSDRISVVGVVIECIPVTS